MSANYEPDYIRDLAEVIWGAVEHGDPRGAEAKLRKALAVELRSAANEIYGYAWQPGDTPLRTLTLEQQGVYMAGANDAHNIVDRLLRARADRMTTSTEKSTDA